MKDIIEVLEYGFQSVTFVEISPKEMVLGIEIMGKSKAYPLSLLREKHGFLKDKINGESIKIEISTDGEILGVRNNQGEVIPHIFSYWFAWQSFHPQTMVFQRK
jgi:uncharacterized protein YuzE